MRYTKLGRTGLDVSRLCLGCMSYGGGNSCLLYTSDAADE